MSVVKPRLLWVGDAVVHTGFSRVTHNILEHLVDDWEIHVIGINYRGDPHQYPYCIYPAINGGDIWGLGRYAQLLPRLMPDAVCLIQDPWIVARFANEVERQDIPMAAYMPVDAPNQPIDACMGLNKLDLAIFYTRFGDAQCRVSGYRGLSEIVPHGVDAKLYTPYDRGESRRRLSVSESLPPDTYIVGNVNRNQPRKRLDLSVQYFAEWLKSRHLWSKPIFLYLHCAQHDSGWNLAALARHYGVENRLMMPAPDVVSPSVGLPEADMPFVYSCFDVQITTTTGEGFGLSQIEGMACGIPQIMPQWSALAEWAAGAALMVTCPTVDTHITINTVGGVPDKAEFIKALDLMYRRPDVRERYAEAALSRAREPRFRWEKVADDFKRHLGKMLIDARARAALRETGEEKENGKVPEAGSVPAEAVA